jgi:hypothetical protein
MRYKHVKESDNISGKILLIECMDGRCNEIIERYVEEKKDQGIEVVVIRYPGGLISGVMKTVEQHIAQGGVCEIVANTHNCGCGAAKICTEACNKFMSKEELKMTQDELNIFVIPIVTGRSRPFTQDDMERLFKKLNEDTLKEIKKEHPEIEIKSGVTDVTNAPEFVGKPMLIVSKSFIGSYKRFYEEYKDYFIGEGIGNLRNVYFIMADNLSEIIPSVDVALKKLKVHDHLIKDVWLKSFKAADKETINSWEPKLFTVINSVNAKMMKVEAKERRKQPG